MKKNKLLTSTLCIVAAFTLSPLSSIQASASEAIDTNEFPIVIKQNA